MNRDEVLKYLVSNKGSIAKGCDQYYWFDHAKACFYCTNDKGKILRSDRVGKGALFVYSTYEAYEPPKQIEKVQLWETVDAVGVTKLCNDVGRVAWIADQQFSPVNNACKVNQRNRTSRTFTLHQDTDGWYVTEGWEE